jgi:hypothetical protein
MPRLPPRTNHREVGQRLLRQGRSLPISAARRFYTTVQLNCTLLYHRPKRPTIHAGPLPKRLGRSLSLPSRFSPRVPATHYPFPSCAVRVALSYLLCPHPALPLPVPLSPSYGVFNDFF